MQFSKGILSSYLFVPSNEVDNIQGLLLDLTVTPKFDGGEPIHLTESRARGWIGVPLFHFSDLKIKKMDDRRIVSPTKIKFIGELRPEQQVVYGRVKETIDTGKTSFLIEANPGFGKTVLAISLISLLGQRTIVVVPRSNLIEQWRERLLNFTTLKRDDIGWVEGGKGEWKNKKVVVALVHSLVLDRYGVEFRRNFGLVVFDEVDRSVPPQTFAPAVAMFPCKFRIGMSAVFKRSDGMDVIFKKHLGEVFLKGGEEGRMKPSVILHFYPQTSGFVFPGSSKLNRRGMLLSKLASNFSRNDVIAKYIKLIWKSDRKCLVLSDRKVQLMQLRGMLLNFGIPDRDIGYYVRSLNGGAPINADERRRVAINCKIILACVTSDTECLTLHGWKNYMELKNGELIATYDLKKDRICYKPLSKVVHYWMDGELCHLQNRNADVLMTWDHRNVVADKRGKIKIERAHSLSVGDRLLLTAPVEYPSNRGLPNLKWAEIFGWVISEGSYQYKAVKICQNEGKNSQRIQELLDLLHLKYRTWEEGKTRRWHLTVGASKMFMRIAPSKELTFFLASLPQKQLKVLFAALIAGDGHTRPDGRMSFIQKSKVNLDWFSVIALRLGYAQVLSSKENGCSVIYLSRKRSAGPINGAKMRSKICKYKGVVWCPVVKETGTWIARRNGKVFITGNTYGMIQLGTDIPDLAGLVYATPQSEVIQTQGRIERELEGKKNPVVVDLIDTAYADALRWGVARKRFYKSQGLKIKEV